MLYTTATPPPSPPATITTTLPPPPTPGVADAGQQRPALVNNFYVSAKASRNWTNTVGGWPPPFNTPRYWRGTSGPASRDEGGCPGYFWGPERCHGKGISQLIRMDSTLLSLSLPLCWRSSRHPLLFRRDTLLLPRPTPFDHL